MPTKDENNATNNDWDGFIPMPIPAPSAISNDKTDKVQNINDVQDDPDDRKHISSGEQQDPHNLQERFVNNQQQMFDMACAEIRKGMKQSCWLWFVLPTAPYFRNGVEQGSSMNRHYALRGDDSVKAYLKFETDGVNLRRNYMQMLTAITSQLKFGNPLNNLLGSSDAPKAISSFRLFQRIATEIKDTELARVCRTVLDLAETRK
jgi:uncharacterized protein (DUF1810 family)